MATVSNLRLTWFSRTRWLTSAVVLTALAAGCAEPPKNQGSQQVTAAPAPAKQPAATQTPAPTPAPAEPAQASGKPAAISPASEKADTASEKAAPARASQAPAAKPNAEQPVTFTPPEDGKEMTDADRAALEEMIRNAVTAAQQEKAQPGPNPPPPPSPTAAKKPATPPNPAADSAGSNPPAEGEEKKDEKKACGPTVPSQPVDLTPLPEDQPQPKFAVKEKKLTSEGVWQGKTAEFKFAISNDGQAPLAIRLKKG